jgi:hypothetical protein
MRYLFRLCIIVCFCGAITMLHGQSPRKQVRSTIQISKIFAVPSQTNIQEELTTYDYTRMIWQERSETTEMVIGHDNKLTITRYFPQMPRFDRDFEFNTGMSVSNEYGTMLFDHGGDLLDSILVETPLELYSIDPDSIEMFATFGLFELVLDEIALVYELNDFTVSTSDELQTLSAINDTMEVYVDKSRMTFEIRMFDESIMIFSDWKKYQIVDGYTIPMVSVFTTYQNLVSGTRMQVSEVHRYTMYQVINESGDTLVSFASDVPIAERKGQIEIARFNETEKQNHELKVYPNPTSGTIHVDIPLFVTEAIQFEIINAHGVAVHKDDNVLAGSSLTLDVSHLKPGLYLVRCGKGNKWKTTRLIKQ